MEVELENKPPIPPSFWRRFSVGSNPVRTWYRLLCLSILAYFILKYLLLPIKVTGYSMFPTYRNGQINYANRLAYMWSKPQRGDIVIIKTTGERVTILKRILGLPGDRIRMQDGKIFINNKELNEPYIKQNGGWRERELELKPDVYWAIGDNRAISEFGKVHASMLVGKILF